MCDWNPKFKWGGGLSKTINFELLKQELLNDIVEGDESYEFNWVGKKAAMVEANKPTSKTLRPKKEDSVNWDNTENLYIEGDNLEVLKLLQESYLGKVKMIYIDPPYNTGNDFVYRDDFKQSKEDYQEDSGEIDEEGNRLFRNTDSNGRFHSDWCSMMYSRLKLAKNLLTDDGIIFISIDDREQEDLKMICNEIYGEMNCVGVGQWRRVEGKPGKSLGMGRTSEFVLLYAKNINSFQIGLLPISESGLREFRYEDNKGKFRRGQIYYPNRGVHKYSVETPYGNTITGDFTISKEKFFNYDSENKIYWAEQGDHTPYLKIYLDDFAGTTPTNTFGKEFGSSQQAVKEFKDLFNTGVMVFDNPKPTKLILQLLRIGNCKNSIIMDFFSGSATTAHAVMQLNAEDGGNRKYIMVQLPEETDEKSEAYKAGYKNICEIGKERIRRAAKKIHEDSPDAKFDDGFRVFKLDSSNMKDVYYSTNDYNKNLLEQLESNIKEDRSSLDLLFQCLLDWGLPISKQYKSEKIDGYDVHFYDKDALVACFDENISEDCIKQIAKRKPLRVVFRDSSFKDSSSRINIEEIFKMLSPKTSVKVI